MNDDPLHDDPARDADELPPGGDELPAADELPPVKPPSAGFIAQLFVVPALIVLAIVGIIGLFGKLSESEQDWRELVQELGSSNEHRRWRAALGLAHLLKADQDRPAGERRLTDNPRVAGALVALLDEQLARRSSRDDDIKQQAFVARTLGTLDVPEVVLPALQRAMQPGYDREVRKEVIASIARVTDRHARESRRSPKLELLAERGLLDDLIDVSHDSDPLIRQLAAYTLGLTPSERSRQRLVVLLNDADRHTQENAAIGLARQNSTAGWPVFRRVLLEASRPDADSLPRPEVPGSTRASADASNAAAIRLVALQNSLKAIGNLAGEWTAEQHSELLGLLRPLAADHAEPRIRTDARQTLLDLERAP